MKLRVKSLSADGESVVVLVKGHDHEETVPATDIIKPKLTVEHVKESLSGPIDVVYRPPIVTCAGCGARCHLDCLFGPMFPSYHYKFVPDQQLTVDVDGRVSHWECFICNAGVRDLHRQGRLKCDLCFLTGSPIMHPLHRDDLAKACFNSSNGGEERKRFVHTACVAGLPRGEAWFVSDDGEENACPLVAVQGIGRKHKLDGQEWGVDWTERKKLKCVCCGRANTAASQCNEESCVEALHVPCAMRAGLYCDLQGIPHMDCKTRRERDEGCMILCKRHTLKALHNQLHFYLRSKFEDTLRQSSGAANEGSDGDKLAKFRQAAERKMPLRIVWTLSDRTKTDMQGEAGHTTVPKPLDKVRVFSVAGPIRPCPLVLG